MMPPKRRRFERPMGLRRYRKLFIIAAEGTKTEPKWRSIVIAEILHKIIRHYFSLSQNTS